MALCKPCYHPNNTSFITYTQPSTLTIKKFFRRQLFKKTSNILQTQTSSYQSRSNARFQRIKGSNIIREINPNNDCSLKTNSTNNYDMTVLHDDTQINLSYQKFKKIPRWAKKSQLQLAFINQVYFNEKSPEDIFGSIQIDLIDQMIQTIELDRSNLSHIYSSSLCPPNFV